MNSKIKSWCVMASLFVTAPAFAEPGKIVLTGTGSASSPPEYVSYSVTVVSICYNSSQEASAANARLSNAVIGVLNGFKKDSRDKVTSTGGANVLQTETTQVGTEARVLCELKWHTENHIEIQLTRIADLPDLQDQLITAVSGTSGVDTATATQTYADVGRPDFQLFPETSKRLRDVAGGLAFDDGKSQILMFQSRCAFVDLRLVTLTAPDYSYAYKLAGEIIRAPDSSAPVIPDELRVDASLRMEWTFTPSGACRY